MRQDIKKILIECSVIIVALAVIAVIIAASLTNGFTNLKPFEKQEVTINVQENVSQDTNKVEEKNNDYLKVDFEGTHLEPNIRLAASEVETYANGTVSKTLTATVLPENAVDKTCDWAIEWVIPVTEGADLSEYLTVTPQSDGSNVATVTAYQGFEGGKARVTVTTRVGKFTAECYIVYDGAPKYLYFVKDGVNYGSLNEIELDAGASYVFDLQLDNDLGAVGSKYTGNYEIYAYGMSGRFTSEKKEILNGTVTSTEEYVVNLENKKAGDLTFDHTYFFNASLEGNKLTINVIRSEKSFLLPLAPVRTGTQYSYKGTYTDPRSGGVPDDCEWYIGVKDTVSGQEELLYFDIICTVESVALSNTSISF